MEVRLPSRVAIPLDGEGLDRIVDFEEAGRATGFLLEGHDIGHPDGWPFFGVWNMAFCETSRCKQRKIKDHRFTSALGNGAVDNEDNPTELYLPAGDYTLHVIADRSPVRVDLKLPGLSGRGSFRPNRPEPHGVIEPTVRASDSPGDVVYSNGQTTDFGGAVVFAVTAIRVRTNASAFQAVGHCWYEDEPILDPDTAFGPGCPGANQILAGGPWVIPFPTDTAFLGYFLFPPESFEGFGSYAVTAAAVDQIDDIAFAIELGGSTVDAAEVARARESMFRKTLRLKL